MALKDEFPSSSTKKIMKIVSQSWQRMTDEEKQQYYILSKNDRARFDDEKKSMGAKNRKKQFDNEHRTKTDDEHGRFGNTSETYLGCS